MNKTERIKDLIAYKKEQELLGNTYSTEEFMEELRDICKKQKNNIDHSRSLEAYEGKQSIDQEESTEIEEYVFKEGDNYTYEDYKNHLLDQFKYNNLDTYFKIDLFKKFSLDYLKIPEDCLENMEEYISSIESDQDKEWTHNSYLAFFTAAIRHFHVYYGIKFHGEDIDFNKVYTLYRVLIVHPEQFLLHLSLFFHIFRDKYDILSIYNDIKKRESITTDKLFSSEDIDPINYIKMANEMYHNDANFGLESIETVEPDNLETICNEFYYKYLEILSEKEDFFDQDSVFLNCSRVDPSLDYTLLHKMITETFELIIEDPEIILYKLRKEFFENEDNNLIINKMTSLFVKRVLEEERINREIVEKINSR